MTGDAVPFLVQVQVNNDVPPMVVRDYAPELDDVRSICEHVHDSGSVGLLLVVAGARMHADVSVELVMLREQLPAARRACRMQTAFELELIEQGIDLRLSFCPVGDVFEVCRAPVWPEGKEVVVGSISTSERITMLDEAMRVFVALTTRVAPIIRRHPWFVAWMDELPSA